MTWTSSPENDKVIAAWVAALGNLDDIPTDANVAAGPIRYRYATLAKVLGEIRPILAKEGIGFSQHVADDGVTTTIWHTSGQWLSFPPLLINPLGTSPQQIGSAVSYARRYSILAICGLATEDDDGSSASTSTTHEVMPTGPNPIAERVDALLAAMKALNPRDQEKLKTWAAEQGHTLAPRQLYENHDWLSEVEAYLDEGIGVGDLGDDVPDE